MELVSIVESRDAVAVEGVFKATHPDSLVPPQGEIRASRNRIDSRIAGFFRVANGRAVAQRVYWDQVDLLRQLGAASSVAARKDDSLTRQPRPYPSTRCPQRTAS